MDKNTSHSRVGFYNTSSSWNNHQRWPYEIARVLYSRGHDVEVFTASRGRLYAKARRYGLKIYKFRKSGFLPFDIFRLARLLKRKKITTLFINYQGDLKTGALAAHMAGVHQVVYRRGTVSGVQGNLINRWVFKRFVTTVITNSDANRSRLVRDSHNMFDPASTRVIYNGLNLQGRRALSEAYHNYRSNGELMVGLMTSDMHTSRLLHLFEILWREDKKAEHFRFLIHGNGHVVRSLKKQLREKPELQKMLIWDTRSRHLVEFMNSVDVFVTGSTSNDFNHPLMYAMARYKPVIAYARGSNPEIIKNNETGFLLSEGDVHGVKQKLEMLRDSDLRLRLGRKARMTLEQRFNMEHSINQIEDLIG